MLNTMNSRRLALCAVVSALALTIPASSSEGATRKKPARAQKTSPLPAMPVTVTPASPVTAPAPRKITTKGGWAAPQVNLPTTVVYDGRHPGPAVSVAPWGGGSGSVTTNMTYAQGRSSIKIVTHGLYQGAKIGFNPGFDLGDRTPSRNRILQLMIRLGQSSEDYDQAGLPLSPAASSRSAAYFGSPGRPRQTVLRDVDGHRSDRFRLAQIPPWVLQRMPPGTRPQIPATADPNQPPGAVPPGIPGMPGMPTTLPPMDDDWTPPVSNFRLLFTLANGAQAEVTRPFPSTDPSEDPETSWLGLGVPLSTLKFPAGQADSPLVSITIGGDGTATFYIGQISLVDDSSPLYCFAGDKQDVASGDNVKLVGRAQGGASMLHFSWDFDAADGIMEEAEGPTVTHRFSKGNKDYTVTLTVSDIDGLKKPVTSTVTIKVEE